MIHAARIVSQPVAAPAEAVYEYTRRMENLTHWAAGLATSLFRVDGEWFSDSPMGRIKIAMAPRNPYGVLDHDVTTPDGNTVHNAFRVTPVGDGSLLAFVVLRLPGMTDDEFDRDAGLVAKDLRTLKTLLEASSS